MSIISGRYGTVVSYLRLMFWTPRPAVETSSEPNLRRPLMCACTLGSATAGVESTPGRVAVTEAPVMPKQGATVDADFHVAVVEIPHNCEPLTGLGAGLQRRLPLLLF